jgi:hypothetical protein
MEPNQPAQPATPEIQTPVTQSNKMKDILITVLLLAIIGGAYYLGTVRQQPIPQKTNNITTIITASPTSILPQASVTPTVTTSQQDVLKIPEYGVQIVLSDEIKDAYEVKKNGYIYLKVHSLDLEPQCKKDDTSTAVLGRVGKDEINPMTEGKYSDSFSNGKIIGSYFYYIDVAQYLCAETATGKAKLEKIRSAFMNAAITQ